MWWVLADCRVVACLLCLCLCLRVLLCGSGAWPAREWEGVVPVTKCWGCKSGLDFTFPFLAIIHQPRQYFTVGFWRFQAIKKLNRPISTCEADLAKYSTVARPWAILAGAWRSLFARCPTKWETKSLGDYVLQKSMGYTLREAWGLGKPTTDAIWGSAA